MSSVVFKGVFLPLLGTSIGSACVFFMKNTLSRALMRSLNGFAAGVMVAASVWSLIIPAIEQSSSLGYFSFFPAVAGFWMGVMFLMILDSLLTNLYKNMSSVKDEKFVFKKNSMLILAVVIHNIPEGMAIGVAIAAYLKGVPGVSAASAIALATGIAIQNFPEGSIISMPLAAKGQKKFKSFFYGFLSGVVEPVATALTILLASIVTPVLPYMLSFAAGAMMFVVVKELVPQMSKDSQDNAGTILFTLGFTLMMALDVALG